jgi:hypothetical protein
VKELGPAYRDWRTVRVMTWFRNLQNEESVLKNVHLFDVPVDITSFREQLDAACDTRAIPTGPIHPWAG